MKPEKVPKKPHVVAENPSRPQEKSNPRLPASLAPLSLHYLPSLMLRAEPRPRYFTAYRILLLPEWRYSLLRAPGRAYHSGTKGETDAGNVHNRENPAPQKLCGRVVWPSLTVALGVPLEARPKAWPIAVAYLETTATEADPDSPALLLQGGPCSTSEADRKPPRGLQGTWLSQGPTQVSELIPAD